MSKYSDLLKDPRWQQKRLQIFERDKWTCQKCGATSKQLHAHHLYYVSGRKPWEYHSPSITTLCEDCHVKRWGERMADWELITLLFLTKGEEFAFNFAGQVAEFCNQTGATEEQVLQAFSWLFKKPGTLIPLIGEVEMKP